MENEEEVNRLVKLIGAVAEETGMSMKDMVPFQEAFYDGVLKETKDLNAEEVRDEDLISIGTQVLTDIMLETEAALDEETNNDNDNEQVEVIEPEEVVPDARTMIEIQTEIGEVLMKESMTLAKLKDEIHCTKEFTRDVVTELIDLGLIKKEKGKQMLHWVTEETTEETEDEPGYTDLVSDEPEVVESDVPHLEEPAEAPAVTTNHAADHAIEVAFATAKLEVLKVLDQQRKASESNPAYKAQAEQYTEVMNSLRAVFDRLQNGPEQYHLHNPIIQELARIAEWQPEA